MNDFATFIDQISSFPPLHCRHTPRNTRTHSSSWQMSTRNTFTTRERGACFGTAILKSGHSRVRMDSRLFLILLLLSTDTCVERVHEYNLMSRSNSCLVLVTLLRQRRRFNPRSIVSCLSLFRVGGFVFYNNCHCSGCAE